MQKCTSYLCEKMNHAGIFVDVVHVLLIFKMICCFMSETSYYDDEAVRLSSDSSFVMFWEMSGTLSFSFHNSCGIQQ